MLYVKFAHVNVQEYDVGLYMFADLHVVMIVSSPVAPPDIRMEVADEWN
jgi:hypothetical protein